MAGGDQVVLGRHKWSAVVGQVYVEDRIASVCGECGNPRLMCIPPGWRYGPIYSG